MDPKFPMRNTTLCYLEQDNAYLMLHRVTKKNDLNHDKWIGVGGKFEPFESPEDCLLREVQEETGLTLTSYRCRGVVTFLLGELTEYMFLYTADAWTGTLVKDAARNEGILEWVPKRAGGAAAHLGGRQDLLPPARGGQTLFLAQTPI